MTTVTSAAATPPSTIKIFLADGSAEGLWIVTKPNWTGKALRFSRNSFKDVRQRAEFGLTGVYMLLGESSASESQREIYIGEAGVVRGRINTHLSQLDWWTEAVVFVATDDFNVSHAKYLEAELLRLAKHAKRSKVMNAQPMQGNQLGEADAADMDIFLQEMLVVYPILGVAAFEAPRKHASGQRFQLRAGGKIVATAQRTSEGFVVFAGAQGRSDLQASFYAYKKAVALREELVEAGLLKEEDDRLVLVEDYLFSSPSLAGNILLGRSVSGPEAWTTEEGKKLKEVEAEEAGSDDTASVVEVG
jgi:hypothetical protein